MSTQSGSHLRRAGVSALAILLLTACNLQKSRTPDDMPSNTDNNCYRFVQGRDTIQLTIRNHGGRINGTLLFLFFEKDKSRGTIDGAMKGDTLLADYTFASEGVESVRQVAFLRRGDTFAMGAGEIQRIENKDVFRDPSEVHFNTGVVLAKASNCK